MSTERWRTNDVVRAMTARADKGLAAVARSVAEELTRTLSVPGGGVPSRPGQPPRSQTGALARAVGVEQARAGMRAGVVDPSQLAKARTLARRRPYLGPTMRRARPRLMAEFIRGAKR
jgi:hypothetical protein